MSMLSCQPIFIACSGRGASVHRIANPSGPGLGMEPGLTPNPSIERTSQRPLRALCAAAHVER